MDARSLLKSLECPVLYLRPSREALVPRRCVETIERLCPDVSIQTLEGSHLILETHPRESWRIIEGFVSQRPFR